MGGVAQQVFVHWQRESPTRWGEQGVSLWQADRGSPTTWRVDYERRFPGYLTVRYRIGDVTRDGRANVLVEAAMGSAGCGSRRMIASVSGKVREILSCTWACEIGMWLDHGELVIQDLVGRCPYRDPSAHCFGGWRRTTKRWNGSKLVTVDASVECVLPRLDPRRGCRPRR
jgi:hypothetical protein